MVPFQSNTAAHRVRDNSWPPDRPTRWSVRVVLTVAAISSLFFNSGCYHSSGSAVADNSVAGPAAPNMAQIDFSASIDLPIDTILAHIGGALTARSGVDILGNATVDGRDYDSLWQLVGTGIFGVVTSDFINLTGSARIGGNGIVPVGKRQLPPVRHLVCAENVAPQPYMQTPEAFLGLEPGALDAYKIPPSSLQTPFHGIVYVTDDCGPVNFGNSSGIFIVHNPGGTTRAILSSGTFKGLIIVDVVSKVPGPVNVLGGVATLGTASRLAIGNGTANVKYSAQVIANLAMYCSGGQ